MRKKKKAFLIFTVFVWFLDIAMIIAAIIDADPSKPLWISFSICNLIYAFFSFTYKKKD